MHQVRRPCLLLLLLRVAVPGVNGHGDVKVAAELFRVRARTDLREDHGRAHDRNRHLRRVRISIASIVGVRAACIGSHLLRVDQRAHGRSSWVPCRLHDWSLEADKWGERGWHFSAVRVKDPLRLLLLLLCWLAFLFLSFGRRCLRRRLLL